MNNKIKMIVASNVSKVMNESSWQRASVFVIGGKHSTESSYESENRLNIRSSRLSTKRKKKQSFPK